MFGRGGEEAELLRAAGIAVRGRPGHHRRRRRLGLRRDPGHPPRRGQRGGVRHRPRGPGQARVGAGLGGAGRASRARSWSTWACVSCRRSPQRLIAGGRPATEPAAVIERGTLPGQRVVTGTLATIAEVAAAAGIRAPAISLFGAGGRAAPRAGLVRGAAAGRRDGGRHPGAGPGQRAGRAAARARRRRRSRRRRSGSWRSTGPAPELERYDLICLTSPNGVRALFERLLRAPGATPARSPGRGWRRSAPARRPRCASTA